MTYILATEPGTKHEGTVTEVDQSAEVRGEEGNTVLIKVAIDKNDLSDLRPGRDGHGQGLLRPAAPSATFGSTT